MTDTGIIATGLLPQAYEPISHRQALKMLLGRVLEYSGTMRKTNQFGPLRSSGFCPITNACYNKRGIKFSVGNPRRAAEELFHTIPARDREEIIGATNDVVQAADGCTGTPLRKAIRRLLMERLVAPCA